MTIDPFFLHITNSALIVEDETAAGIIDATEIAHDIKYTTTIMYQPGTLTFSLKKDPAGILRVGCGSKIEFGHNGKNIFRGIVFHVGTNSSGECTVTAYDSLRYLQNHDIVLIEDKTLLDVFDMVASKYLELSSSEYTINNNANLSSQLSQPLTRRFFNDKSIFDILKTEIEQFETLAFASSSDSSKTALTDVERLTSIENASVVHWYIRDDYGKVVFDYTQPVKDEKGILIIGDESLMMDYSYEVDMENLYNEILAADDAVQDEEGNIIDVPVTTMKHEESISKYGTLRKVVQVHNKNNARTKDDGNTLLENYLKTSLEVGDRLAKTLTISALGDDDLKAGSSFWLKIDRLSLDCSMTAITVTHNYGDRHTMDIECCVPENVLEVLH